MKKLFGATAMVLLLSFISIFTIFASNPSNPPEISDGFPPTGIVMPRSGTIKFTGEQLEAYLALTSIKDTEGIVKVILSYIPLSSPVFETRDSISPRFASYEVRNVRTVSGDRIYTATLRSDLLENFSNSTSSFTRTLSGTATSGFTANAGVSASGVSAGVGFQMSVSQTATTTYTASVPARTRVTLESAVRAHEVNFNVGRNPCIGGDWTRAGTGNAHRPNGMWVREIHRAI